MTTPPNNYLKEVRELQKSLDAIELVVRSSQTFRDLVEQIANLIQRVEELEEAVDVFSLDITP